MSPFIITYIIPRTYHNEIKSGRDACQRRNEVLLSISAGLQQNKEFLYAVRGSKEFLYVRRYRKRAGEARFRIRRVF